MQINHVFDGNRSRVAKIIAKPAAMGLFHNRPFVQVRTILLLAIIDHGFAACRLIMCLMEPRSRVEKIISKPAGMGLFHNGKCRLGYELLLATVKITLHTSAVWSRLRPQFDGQ